MDKENYRKEHLLAGISITRRRAGGAGRDSIEIEATRAGTVALDPVAFLQLAERFTTEEDRKTAEEWKKALETSGKGHKMVDCQTCGCTWDKFYYKKCPGCDGTVPPLHENGP